MLVDPIAMLQGDRIKNSSRRCSKARSADPIPQSGNAATSYLKAKRPQSANGTTSLPKAKRLRRPFRLSSIVFRLIPYLFP